MPFQPASAGSSAEPLEQVERELEPVGLLGVDVEADVVRAREQRELLQPRIELAMHALELRARVARMQRRELDRDARALVDAAPGRGAADRVDRVLVGAPVALRRRPRSAPPRRACRTNSGSPRASQRPRVGERLVDRLAGDELLAHQPHRHVDALADHRLAAACRSARVERARRGSLAVGRDQLAGDQQAPGRGVDEQRRAAAEVRAASRPSPILSRISASRVAASGMRSSASARHISATPSCDDSENSCIRPWTRPSRPAAPCVAQRLREPARQRLRGVGGRRRQARRGEQRRHALGLGPAVGGGDRGARSGERVAGSERASRARPDRGGRAAQPERRRQADGSVARRRRLEVAAVAFVDDHRAGVAAIEQVVDAHEAGQRRRRRARDVAGAGIDGRETGRARSSRR